VNIVTASGGLVGGPSEMIRRFLLQGARLVDIPPRDPQPVNPGRRVRVLAVVHGWFPVLAAGSERMVQHMLDALPRDEFEVRVWHFGIGEPEPSYITDYEHEGLPVRRSLSPPPDFDPDVILFHHGYAARVVPSLFERYPGAWVVAVYHNDRFDIEDIKRVGADLSVYNTRWVKESLRGKGIVVHPPLEPDRHSVESTGDSVTLINLQINKGVLLWDAMHDRLPEYLFLGVLGTHGEQEWTWGPHGNVTIKDTTQDMREVWRESKIVLMPSEYESYGMVAAEACVNGIPVIAHPTPGLVECLGGAGIFIDRSDTDGYERAIRLLMTDPQYYAERSGMARYRGQELVKQTERELNRFVNRLRKMVRP
jgi:glycosyltransferase involved in cell wall biosynthesis